MERLLKGAGRDLVSLPLGQGERERGGFGRASLSRYSEPDRPMYRYGGRCQKSREYSVCALKAPVNPNYSVIRHFSPTLLLVF